MPGAKMQSNNPANDPDLKPVKGHSQFKLNMSLYKTHRYGMIEPHYALEVVPDDKKVSYRSGSDVDTQNLKAPLMTPVKMNKDTFFVPMRAILPFNSDLITTNPLTGDDVIPEDVNCVVNPLKFAPLVQQVGAALVNIFQGLDDSGNAYLDTEAFLGHTLMRTLVAYQIGSPILSYGSLAQSLGYNFAACFYGYRRKDGTFMTFDETLDVLFQYLASQIKRFSVVIQEVTIDGMNSVSVTNHSLLVDLESDKNDIVSGMFSKTISLRSLLELLEQGSVLSTISNIVLSDTASGDITFPYSSYGLIADPLICTDFSAYYNNDAEPLYVNLERLVAYQLVCSSFYTDDAVDYVYTSKLWHQNMRSLYNYSIGNSAVAQKDFYYLNGARISYDSVSGAILNHALSYLFNVSSGLFGTVIYDEDSSFTGVQIVDGPGGFNTNCHGVFYYYINLFGYQRSLRYRDYFVGSRVAPLAVGDVTVAVNNNSVDVVDVTKNIMMQRFLNQVNRVGRRIKEYSSGIFGVAPRNDLDEPIFLSSVSNTIGAEETSNTGVDQLTLAQTTTSKLRKDASNFIFSSDFNEFGVVIGVTTFDAVRPLPDAADRQLFHVDRFDMFNPFMQHIGDQEVSSLEIHPITTDPFGYKLRYSEYKQRTDRVAGGFSGRYLPGFCFAIDANDLGNPLGSLELHISPDFIRIKPHEFDRFFNTLPFHSMAGYFHFIIRHDNEVSALRPMDAAPSIL